MAHDSDLPCDADGTCMLCKAAAPDEDKLVCATCATPWHVPCLSTPLQTLSSALEWQCPDCSPRSAPSAAAPPVAGGLIAAIRAIELDASLSEPEKARRRQELMSGGPREAVGEKSPAPEKSKSKGDVLGLLDESLNCSFCMQLPERPVTTPCGHNFCLKCFEKWVGQGKRSCAKCRQPIPAKMASQPRINSALVVAIRMANRAYSTSGPGPLKHLQFVHNQNRPDKPFTTERAKKAGKANACSGKIFVTVPPDHFGPILPENDPLRNRGVLTGESWEDRLECRQWGAHLPHVAGIAGQCDYGAQSVALSGGYEDDEDHGDWFLYTGSGGRDLSGNKRTNKEQSFDQKFEKLNQALRISCKKGYPVRVVRSHKEKRSSYAPETGVRYDGIYRIEKCWRKVGVQGFKVCRYLFVRCDNEPAPWTSDEHGDRPRPLPVIAELKKATDITQRKESPAWDYDEEHGWRWAKPPPISRKQIKPEDSEERGKARFALRKSNNLSVRERLLKEFSCQLCREVMNFPLTTPCGHNFCKLCLESKFAGTAFIRQRTCEGGRTLRVQKNIMKCPSCPNDISDFLQNPQVNREMMDVIESLKRETEVDKVSDDGEDCTEKSGTSGDNVTEVGSENPAVLDSCVQEDEIPITDKHSAIDKQKTKRKKSETVCDDITDVESENLKILKSNHSAIQKNEIKSKMTDKCKYNTRGCSSNVNDGEYCTEKSGTTGDDVTEVGSENPAALKSGIQEDEIPITEEHSVINKQKTKREKSKTVCDDITDVESENPKILKSNDSEIQKNESKSKVTHKRKYNTRGCSSNVNVKWGKKSKKAHEAEVGDDSPTISLLPGSDDDFE